ncbi:MAG: MBL fold metallo-hydrolase [Gluconacetobacter diazotrophicus]|nr:MBL fold metallo-hydrolase [Gluconacetobacter diazotrophicus]
MLGLEPGGDRKKGRAGVTDHSSGRVATSRGAAIVTGFHDEATGSVQYVVADPATGACAIIDPVLDLDRRSGTVSTRNADRLLEHVAREGLEVAWILDTHPHADHLSGAGHLRDRTGAPTGTGAAVTGVQRLWKSIYGLPEDFPTDGSQWDRLFAPGDVFRVGALEGRILFSPGHTMCSISYLVADAAFIHDTVFVADAGTARADFPGGDARALWRSIGAIMALPEDMRLFVGHDYRPGGRTARWETTVAELRDAHPHLKLGGEDAFAAMREERDRTLPLPELMLHALQVNIAGGRLPEPDARGVVALRIPLRKAGMDGA